MPLSKQKPIRILIAEDFHAETEALLRELMDAEMHFSHEIAHSEDQFSAQLVHFKPDIILSPYSLKTTNAVKLLSLSRQQGNFSPFILLAYDLSEDIAIELLAQGMEDYVLRSTIKRLPVAIKKALQRHATQLELLRSEARLRNSEESLRNMLRNAPIPVAMFDLNMNYLVVSDTWLKQENKTEAALLGKNHYNVVPELAERWRKVHQKCLGGAHQESEQETIKWANGKRQVIRWKMNPWYNAEGKVGGTVLFMEDISVKTAAIEAVAKNQKLLGLGEKIGKSGSFELNLKTGEKTWSKNLYHITGFEPGITITDEMYAAQVHPDDRAQFIQELAQIVKSKQTFSTEYRFIRPDNEQEVTLRVASTFLKNDQGKNDRLLGTVTDVTEHQDLASALKKSQASLLLAQSIAKIGSWELHPETLELWWSDQMYRVYEIEPEQLSLEYVHSLTHPDDVGKYEKGFENVLKNKPTYFTYRIISPKTGKVKFVQGVGKIIYDSEGKAINITGTLQDVTETKTVERELLEKEQVFREMAENIDGVFWLTDWKSNKVLYISPQYERIYGQTQKSLYENSKSWTKAIHPKDLERVRTNFAKNAPLGTYDEEYRLCLKDGTVRWVRDRAFPIYDEFGNASRMAGISEDITQRKKDHDQIETLSLVASETINGVLIQDADGNIIWCNKGFTVLTGFSINETKGKRPWSFLKGEETNLELAKEAFQSMKEGSAFTSNNIIYKKDGTPIWVTVLNLPIMDDNNQLAKIVSIGTDITEVRSLRETQVKLSQEIEALRARLNAQNKK